MRILVLTLLMLTTAALAFAGTGMVNVKSTHSVKDTADKLEGVLKSKGMKVFLRVNHAAGAKSVGKELRDTELVLFGNPKVGAPLMRCSQGTGIDLPQKALIWKDAKGQVWLSYNDPAYLNTRHQLVDCAPVLKKVAGALAKFAKAATN